MLKIKRDDEVIVIAGRDKGKRGTVRKVLNDGRLIVSGSESDVDEAAAAAIAAVENPSWT